MLGKAEPIEETVFGVQRREKMGGGGEGIEFLHPRKEDMSIDSFSFSVSWAGGWGDMASWYTSRCWIPEPWYIETEELCDFKVTHGL